jgi:predicted nucleic acid-binding protein
MIRLLDINILSDLIRQPDGLAARRLAEVGDADVVTSVIVAGELRYGAAKRGSQRLTERVEAVLSEIDVRDIDETTARASKTSARTASRVRYVLRAVRPIFSDEKKLSIAECVPHVAGPAHRAGDAAIRGAEIARWRTASPGRNGEAAYRPCRVSRPPSSARP